MDIDRELNFQSTLNDYSEGLRQFEYYKDYGDIDSESAFRSVIRILKARDVIDKIVSDKLLLGEDVISLNAADEKLEVLKKHFYWTARSLRRRRFIEKIHGDEPDSRWKSIYCLNLIDYWKERKTIQPKLKNDHLLQKFLTIWDMFRCLLFDKLDLLWKIFTLGFTAFSLALLGNMVPRFWVSGITPENFIGTALPGLLSILISKDTLGQVTNGYGVLEKSLKKLPIIPAWIRQELAFCLAFILFWIILFCHQNLNTFSTCYYQRGLLQIPTKLLEVNESPNWMCGAIFMMSGTNHATLEKSISKAEDDFKRSVALNPDHQKSNFYLGWLYELKQDLKNAEIYYSIAMQNKSILSRIRLANFHIPSSASPESINESGNESLKRTIQSHSLHSSLTKASNLIMGGWKDAYDVYERQDEIVKELAIQIQELVRVQKNKDAETSNNRIIAILNSLLEARSYFSTVAHIRADQSRDLESLEAIQYALEIHKSIMKISDSPSMPSEIMSTPLLCMYGEYLQFHPNTKIEQGWLPPIQKSENSPLNMDDELAPVWQGCLQYANSGDFDDDLWLTRVWNYLPLRKTK
jgi:tetratricopeptide (TPR) repeat protein